MLYNLKKSLEATYYKYCIREGKLPAPDIFYYHWDKKKLNTAMLNKEKSPRKEKKKKKKPVK